MGVILNNFPSLESLSRGEKATLSMLDCQPELLQKLNLTELAHSLNSSNAAIIRLTQKLGYSGFSEFKFAVNNILKENSEISTEFLVELQTFDKKLVLVDKASRIDSYAKSINEAHTVYIAGIGSSKMIAEYMSHRLNQLDKPAFYVYDDALLDLLPNLITTLKTLVIYISISGETEKLVKSAKKVAQTGAKLLSITNVQSSSLTGLTSQNISTNTSMKYLHNYDITPRSFHMIVVDLIIERFISNYYKK